MDEEGERGREWREVGERGEKWRERRMEEEVGGRRERWRERIMTINKNYTQLTSSTTSSASILTAGRKQHHKVGNWLDNTGLVCHNDTKF